MVFPYPLPGEFAIKTCLTGDLITARDGGNHDRDALITSATDIGPNEKFRLYYLPGEEVVSQLDGSISFEPDITFIITSGGYYVTAVDGGGATAAAAAFDTTSPYTESATDFESFGVFAVQSIEQAGKNVEVVDDGARMIQTWSGSFVTALGGGGKPTEAFHTDAMYANTWENFYILKCGDLIGDGAEFGGPYAIRPLGTGYVPGVGNNPRFISATGGGGRVKNAMTSSTTSGDNEVFKVQKNPNGTYSLRTKSDNFVTAVGDGGIAHPTSSSDTLHTDATEVRAWEQFNIEERSPGVYGIQTGSGFWIGMDPQFKTFSTRLDPPENAGSIGYTALFEFLWLFNPGNFPVIGQPGLSGTGPI